MSDTLGVSGGLVRGGMKKVFRTGVNDTNVNDVEGVGTLRVEGECWYKWVSFVNNVSQTNARAGAVVVYTGLNTVDIVASGYGFAAGVQMAPAIGTLGTAYFGWIQIKGPAILSAAPTGAPAAGQPLTVSGFGLTAMSTTIATLVTQFNAGTFLGATLGGNAAAVNLDCSF
jgi:hypothetical protein